MDAGASYYQISDSMTGEQIVSRTLLPNGATDPRVFILKRFFIVTFKSVVTATNHLQYVAIPLANPTTPGTTQDISSSVAASAGYDAVTANNALYFVWAGASTTIKLAYLTVPGWGASSQVLSSAVTISSKTATLMSVTADESGSAPVIWASFWDSGSTDGYSMAYDAQLNAILTPTQIITGTSIAEITSVATDSTSTVFYEVNNNYSSTGAYPVSSIKTHYVDKNTITIGGAVGTVSTILRSVGLASKAFFEDDGTIHMLVAYGTTASPTLSNQPTYFLIDSDGNIYMRMAYSNGGGYASNQVLPNVSSIDGYNYIPYLLTDFLESVNKGTSLPSGTPTNAIYTQTGINLAKIGINKGTQLSSEIADVLTLTGGQTWMYDGITPVEQGFHVWPENVAIQGNSTVGSLVAATTYFYTFTYEWTDNQGELHRSAPSIPITYVPVAAPANFTGNRTSGSPTLTGVSSFTGLQVGQAISGTGIPAATYILSLNSGASTLTMSANATSGTSTSTTVTPVAVTTVSLYVPTLRLTYKDSPNPVRIVGYRWSSTQETYYQFTSLTSPTLNSLTTDYVTITDGRADSAILGNTLLYTTGGVVENIAPPASMGSALFKNRMFLVPSENPNTLWFSKQVIQNVPVEFSDLFTLYVAPTTGAQGSTGPVKCISAMDDKLIIFKKDAIYYVTGNGPDNTGLNNDFGDPVFITASVGCSNPNSIVLMPMGLMFQSDKGIWLLSRDLSTNYIGDAVEAYNNETIQSAENIPGTNQVRFVLDTGVTLTYDYYYQQWSTFTNINAISATLYQGFHTYLNQYGQVFQELPGSYMDGSKPVLMKFKTSWIQLAGLRGFQRFYYALLLGKYVTPFRLNVQFSYDYLDSPVHNVIVTPDNASPAYGDDSVYGSGDPYGGPGNVFSHRVFPEIQKCESFLLTVSEIYDSTEGVPAGAGLTLSAMNIVIGVKRGFGTQRASRSSG
jgi:hypothetical protein